MYKNTKTLTYCYSFKGDVDGSIMQRYMELYANLYLPFVEEVVVSQKNTIKMINSMDVYEIGVASLKLMQIDCDKEGLHAFIGRGYVRNVSNDCLVVLISDCSSLYYYVIDDMYDKDAIQIKTDVSLSLSFLEYMTGVLHEVLKKQNKCSY